MRTPWCSAKPGTRRAIGLVLWCAALGSGAVVGTGAACTHEPQTVVVHPDEPPPALPPASGSPIGFLVDAGELKLSDDQLAKLKVIDDDLAANLAYLDNVQRNALAGQAQQGKDDSHTQLGGGFSHDDGMANRTAAGTPQGGAAAPAVISTGTGGPSKEEIATTLKQVPDARAHNTRNAIRRAFQVLDAGQQQLARKLLKDRGVDPDTGQFEATGEPGRTSSGSDSH
jgi:hypothetical protein